MCLWRVRLTLAAPWDVHRSTCPRTLTALSELTLATVSSTLQIRSRYWCHGGLQPRLCKIRYSASTHFLFSQGNLFHVFVVHIITCCALWNYACVNNYAFFIWYKVWFHVLYVANQSGKIIAKYAWTSTCNMLLFKQYNVHIPAPLCQAHRASLVAYV